MSVLKSAGHEDFKKTLNLEFDDVLSEIFKVKHNLYHLKICLLFNFQYPTKRLSTYCLVDPEKDRVSKLDFQEKSYGQSMGFS